MPRLIIALLAVIGFNSAVTAAGLQDYAYQGVVSESERQLQRVELPLEVILALTRADVGDLAVFNDDGKQLPHSITRSPEPVTEMTQALPFHEFDRFLQRHSKTVTTREQSQQPGSVSELETTETVAVQSVRKNYLIELAADNRRRDFKRIDLEWVHEPASQLLELKVEVGDELDGLRVFKQRKSLTNNASNDISWRSISGFPKHRKYMRLTPSNAIDSFELRSVRAHFQQVHKAPRIGYRLEPEAVKEDGAEFYFFNYPSVVKAESMRIIPAAAHSVIRGDLLATWGNLEDRQYVRRGFRQHNIDDDEVRASEPIPLPRGSYKDFWFTSQSQLPTAPTVELLYPQYEVIFLSDGNGPYALAWGNYESRGASNDLSSILDDSLQQVRRRSALVSLGAIEEAGGAARLSPKAGLPWKKWLLWTLLIMAAMLTAKMVFSLYREMNNPAAAETPKDS